MYRLTKAFDAVAAGGISLAAVGPLASLLADVSAALVAFSSLMGCCVGCMAVAIKWRQYRALCRADNEGRVLVVPRSGAPHGCPPAPGDL